MKKIFYFYIFLLVIIILLNLINLKDKKYTNFNTINFSYEHVLKGETGGYIDIFPEEPVSLGKDILISGWGYNPQTNNLAEGIIIVMDGKTVLPVEFYKVKRPDIVEAKSNIKLLKSGWETKFSSNILGIGKHTIEMFLINKDEDFIPIVSAKSQKGQSHLIIK